MKTLVYLVLFTISCIVHARDFGGITFHSQLPSEQFALLTRDLRYLFGVGSSEDKELQRISGLPTTSGPLLHNYIVNRVRAIVGEEFSIQGSQLIQRTDHVFPNTPLPQISSNNKTFLGEEDREARVTMSNLGTGLYLGGKAHQTLLGIRLDRKTLLATSPRVGIIQVGEGLFHPSQQLNQAPAATANTIARLSTLFHEARHSDGTGASTGFVHTLCPEGHALAGRPACDVAHNGSYRLAGLIERHLLNQCSSCSETEKTMLAANVSDSFSRSLRLTTTDEITQLHSILETYVNTRNLYRAMLPDAPRDRVGSINAEIEKLNQRIAQTEQRLAVAQERLDSISEVLWDATPEGQFSTISLRTSIRLMRGRQ